MYQITKKIIIFASLVLIAASCNKAPAPVATAPLPSYNYTHKLIIGNKILDVELANTLESQKQGLSDRASMQDSQGMIFDFGPGTGVTPGFWMKDMKFDLDLIWIAENKIVGITPDVLAPINGDKNLPLYYSPTAVNQVLEVNAGWSAKNEIKIGDTVELK